MSMHPMNSLVGAAKTAFKDNMINQVSTHINEQEFLSSLVKPIKAGTSREVREHMYSIIVHREVFENSAYFVLLPGLGEEIGIEIPPFGKE